MVDKRSMPGRLVIEFDVVVVGAGAAGVGMGIVLRDLGLERFTLLERHQVGASFAGWPAEMRFITPSFTGNAFGLMDLNAVARGTSPAFSLRCEHPSGQDYARYLAAVAEHFELPVRLGVDVRSIQPFGDRLRLQTSVGEIASRFVIWAAGEFQYPNLDPFPGAEHCLHSASVSSWGEVSGQDLIVIGGFESGVDAAVNLAGLGRNVLVLDPEPTWEIGSSDPSLALSPYTRERLEASLERGQLSLAGDAFVREVRAVADGFEVVAVDGRVWTTPSRPILATGFTGSLSLIADCFEFDQDGVALLSEVDESTRTPGLFVVGPEVEHEGISFCFIYKFRQRFAVVADAVGQRLGLDTSAFVEQYRAANMFLDDLSCCDDDCAC